MRASAMPPSIPALRFTRPFLPKPAAGWPVLVSMAMSWSRTPAKTRGGVCASPGQYERPRMAIPLSVYFQRSFPVSGTSA